MEVAAQRYISLSCDLTDLSNLSMLASLKAALYPPPINRQANTKDRLIS